jgi:hypothetical protein
LITHTYKTALVGGIASLLAAFAIAAPAGAAETTPTATSFSSGATEPTLTVPDAPERAGQTALPAVQHVAIDFSRPGG